MGVPGSANFLLAGAQGYQIERSLRFNSADSAYLNRTYSGACLDAKLMTISVWVKRGKLTTAGQQPIFSSYSAVRFGGDLTWTAADKIQFRPGGNGDGASNQYSISTDAVFRDPSAWYHIVIQYDSTQATSTNRQKIYVNGVQQTVTGNYPTQNYLHTYAFNNANNQIGAYTSYGTDYLDSYLTEFHFIDGQALTPSSFGETDTITGVWKPKRYSGTYGTNGFYLKFADNSGTTSTTLGKDSSGNGNNWTPNNFSVTAGAGNDSLIDTPTPYADGGNGRGNYCTLNPLDTGGPTPANGNLDISWSSANWRTIRCTQGITTGKWYWEFTVTSTVDSNNTHGIGIATSNAGISNYLGADANGWAYTTHSGNKANNGTNTAYGNTVANTDVVGVAFDATNGKLFFAKNNTWQASGDPAAGTNAAFTGLTSGPYLPAIGLYGNSVASGNFNFGQRSFSYTPPAGFLALNTQNLPEPTIKKPSSYFDAKLYTGNGGTQTISGLGFSPDLVWIKGRSNVRGHRWLDAVRGATNFIASNLDNAESVETSGLTAFTSDGFSLGSDLSYNGSGETLVAWCWDANGSGSSNTAGTITSTVSANASAGFSIVTYTGNGVSGATVGHGLGVTPSMVISKCRAGTTAPWYVKHKNLSSGKNIYLNLTDAEASLTNSGGIGDLSSSSTFTCAAGAVNSDNVNANGRTYVTYCFAEVAGYSKFGSYTGNGSSDGPFVYCGFRPAWLLVKRSDGVTSWIILDNRRTTSNPTNVWLNPDASVADQTNSADFYDFTSNGFKLKYSGANNASGGTYIFAAFAESPFKYSLAR